jgi:hypothetical protein
MAGPTDISMVSKQTPQVEKIKRTHRDNTELEKRHTVLQVQDENEEGKQRGDDKPKNGEREREPDEKEVTPEGRGTIVDVVI